MPTPAAAAEYAWAQTGHKDWTFRFTSTIVKPRKWRLPMPKSNPELVTWCGRQFTMAEMAIIQGVVKTCPALSRMELAQTVCELLDWRRPNGGLKGRECSELLATLETQGTIKLPTKRPGRPPGKPTTVPMTPRGEASPPLLGELKDVAPISLTLVRAPDDRLLWRELVGRYHYLGVTVPFGAHLRYLIRIAHPQPSIVGCLQFSSPAWRMAPRDRWIGWDDTTRAQKLQRIVNNSRFLLLPWVHIRNLASKVLSLAARQIRQDWQTHYGIYPLLLETLVDISRFNGTCYRAANWIDVGMTKGRGRMDRENKRHGESPKRIYLYPLVADTRKRLRAL